MKVNQIITQNNLLQTHPTKENEQYYGKLLIYIRTMSMIRDEKKSEEMLLEILEDILEGQEKAISAELYLGKNPKQVADSIIKELPIHLMDFIKLIFAGLGSFLFVSIIPTLVSFKSYIDYGNLLITGTVATLFAISFLFFKGYTLYNYKSKIINVILKVYLFIGLVIAFLMMLIVKTGLRIPLSNTFGIVLIVIFLTVLSYAFIRIEEKSLWIPFIPVIVIFAIIGILMRLSFFKPHLESQDRKIGVAIVSVASMVSFYFLIWFLNRKKPEKKHQRTFLE